MMVECVRRAWAQQHQLPNENVSAVFIFPFVTQPLCNGRYGRFLLLPLMNAVGVWCVTCSPELRCVPSWSNDSVKRKCDSQLHDWVWTMRPMADGHTRADDWRTTMTSVATARHIEINVHVFLFGGNVGNDALLLLARGCYSHRFALFIDCVIKNPLSVGITSDSEFFISLARSKWNESNLDGWWLGAGAFLQNDASQQQQRQLVCVCAVRMCTRLDMSN